MPYVRRTGPNRCIRSIHREEDALKLLPDADGEALRSLFRDAMQGPVTILLYTRESPLIVPGREPCGPCRETRALLEDLTSLSPHLSLEVYDVDEPGSPAAGLNIEYLPTVVVRGAAKGEISWLGLPAGYEFSAFVDLLLDVGEGYSGLQPETKAALHRLDTDIAIQVFVAAQCPYCPAVAQLAQRMAVESARITTHVIEAGEFPGLAQRYQVSGVPQVVVNDRVAFGGAPTEERFLEYLLQAAGAGGAAV